MHEYLRAVRVSEYSQSVTLRLNDLGSALLERFMSIACALPGE